MLSFRILLILFILPSCLLAQTDKNGNIEDLQLQLKNASTQDKQIQALIDIGEYQIEREFNQAEDYLKQAFKLIKENENTYQKELATVYKHQGVINRRKGNYGNAIILYFKSREIYEKLKDTSGIAEVIHNIALLYRFQNDNKKAISYYKKSLELSTKIKDTLNVAASYNMLGVSFRRIQQIDSALICYQKAEDLFKALKKEEEITGVYNNMSTLYSTQKQFDKSLPIKLSSLAYYKKIGNKTSISKAYYKISVDYSKLKQHTKALKYADSSLQVALKIGQKEQISRSYLRKSAIYRDTKHFKNAYDNYRYFKKYSDSILNMQSIKKTKELELKYQFEKEKKELETIAQQDKTKFNFYLLILSMIIIAISCIAYLLRRDYTARTRIIADKLEKEELKQEILTQKIKVSETELKSLVADNSMRLKFIQELSNQLKEDKQKTKSSDIQKYIHKLLLKLSLQINTEEKLSNLQQRIKDVNINFEKILAAKYPSLTASEREVSALLRINLSIKEVATIRNSSIDSIKSIRYRLRKKFDLSKDIELEKFIQSL